MKSLTACGVEKTVLKKRLVCGIHQSGTRCIVIVIIFTRFICADENKRPNYCVTNVSTMCYGYTLLCIDKKLHFAALNDLF